MGTRLVVIEVEDTASEDALDLAIQEWNLSVAHGPGDPVVYRKLYSTPVGDPAKLS